MMGEASWTDCAAKVMEEKEQVWFTVQAIVTEIRERNMKPSMCHMPVNEACRSLRSCLRHHAKKENGKFVRKNSSTLILYALRKGLKNKLPSSTNRESSCNSLKKKIIKPALQPPRIIDGALVVEIDSPDHNKSQRPRVIPEVGQPGFLLPSPSSSLLGTRRTLSVLSAGDGGGRPVRRTRGRKPRDWDHTNKLSTTSNDSHTTNITSPFTSPTAVLESEEVGSVLTRDNWFVAFLKSSYNDTTINPSHHSLKPAHVQGDWSGRIMCQVDPDSIFSSDSTTSSCDDETDETDSSTEDETPPTLQTVATPNSIPSNSTPKTLSLSNSYSESNSPFIPVPRRPESTRQLSVLMSPTSPLIGENLKVILGMVAFNNLPTQHKHQLIKLLPLVDQSLTNTLQPISLNNSFYGSACREWQDQLALGFHGNSSGRSKVEKKNKANCTWKDSFFESEWGQSEERGENDEMFYPCDHDPPLSRCLASIIQGYHSRTTSLSPPPPPPLPPRPTLPCSIPRKKSVPKVTEKTEEKSTILSRTKRENKNNCKLSVVVKKQSQKNHLDKSRANKSMFLSSLPHKMSYTSLIDALYKASQLAHRTKVSPPTPTLPLPDMHHHHHTHSVFHDHFSTLRPDSVPSAFLSSPLVISLPRHLFDTVLSQRYILSEHNYTPLTSDLHHNSSQNLFRPAHSLSSCSSHRLSLCSTCNSLYHPQCSHGNLCPTCSRNRNKPLS